MDDRDKNLIMKRSNLLHMDEYQKRKPAGKANPERTKKSDGSRRRKKTGGEPDERPNVGDEKRPA